MIKPEKTKRESKKTVKTGAAAIHVAAAPSFLHH
jgi:hypothetical protein